MSTRLISVLVVGEALENFPQLLRWLDSRGCRCQLAQSYRDACNLVSCTQFDLVLSQYQLSDRTAFPLLDRLVGSPATLFFSARVEDGSLWLKMLDRGNRCVGAPLLRSDDLSEALGTVLDAAVQRSASTCVATASVREMSSAVSRSRARL